MKGLVATAIVATAWLVVPLGVEPGLHSSLKLAVVAIVVALIAMRLRREHVPPPFAIVAFLASALISAIAGVETLPTSAPIVISIGCLCVLSGAIRHSPDAGERALAVACAGIVVIAAIELLGADLPWSWNRRPESTLGNRNHVAEYLVVALPVLVLRAVRGGRAAKLLVMAAITTIVATHCRTAYLAGFAAVAVAVAVHRHRALPRWLLGGAAVAILLGAAPWPGVHFTQSAGDSLSRVFAVEGSGEARLAQHAQALAALREPSNVLIGVGPGGWMRVAGTHAHASGDHAPRFSGATVPNSEWLRTVVEQGVLGFLALLGIAATAIRAALRDPDRQRRTSRLAALATIAIVGTFDPLIARPEMIALLSILLAHRGAELAQRGRARYWWRVAACGVAAVVAGLRCASFVASSAGAPAAAAKLWPRAGLVERRVLQLANRGACRDAERAYGELAAERPYLWGARVALVRCYARTDVASDERRIWRAALAIEPHLRALVNQEEER
jgi:O-antigen ligase